MADYRERDEKIKQDIYSAMSIINEVDALLGSGRGYARACWNKNAHSHGDKSASLSFDPKTGAWRCHACQEKGDIFTLYMKVKGCTFPVAIKYYMQKFSLWHEAVTPRNKEKRKKLVEKFPTLSIIESQRVRSNSITLRTSAEKVEFIQRRYGLTPETQFNYWLGYDKKYGRLCIPIFRDEPWKRDRQESDVVNARYHDVFRVHCSWHNSETDEEQRARPSSVTDDKIIEQDTYPWSPVWGKKSGSKVLHTTGHGGSYLFPYHVLHTAPSLYVVGGELKAILMNQVGAPAVCWTAGEGGFEEEFLPLFIGKSVRVLMDLDDAGVLAAEKLSQVLANAGAYVEKAIWPDDVKAMLPKKGDVTDLLVKSNLNKEALDLLEWVTVERQVPPTVDLALEENSEKSWDDMVPADFNGLVDPNQVKTWVRFPGTIAGRGETPYVVPREVRVGCPFGKVNPIPLCKGCSLPRDGHAATLKLSTEGQAELVGMSTESMDGWIRKRIGIPPRCHQPQFDNQNSAVESVILTPHVESGAAVSESSKYEFAHRQAIILSEKRLDIKDNQGYEFGGQVIPNPKNSSFTVAIREYRPLQGNIFAFQPDPQKDAALRSLIEEGGYQRLITELREHVCHIYGQDEMLLAILLSMVLPFQFRLGDLTNERICPAVMILGDTTVGKSTATKAFIRHFGAGRYNTMDSRATFVGLIGGNLNMGNRMAFVWGLLPNSNGAFVALDEYSKLSTDDIGSTTNTLSSGIAERVTANGNRKTMCNVRALYLTNPRGARELKTYSDPLEAAMGVMGTVQDLGRVEYVHIQHQIKNVDVFRQQQKATTEHKYTRDLARYHLSWAWSLTADKIVFENPNLVMDRATLLAEKFHHTLLIPAQARFKIARFAAGFAILSYSMRDGKLVVTDEHLDMAIRMFDKNYSKLLSVGAMEIPSEIKEFFDGIKKWKPLKILTAEGGFSKDDLVDAFNQSFANRFINLAHFEYNLLTKKRNTYTFTNDYMINAIRVYLAERERSK
jgi:hypothetical protein